MNFEGMDHLSRSFAIHLLAVYPEWSPFVRRHRLAGDDHHHIVVEVPAPDSADLASPLTIHTDNGEVTVDFDYYHEHFGWPPEREPATSWESPMALIASILDEGLATASGWDHEEWLGSWLVEQGQDPLAQSTSLMTWVRVRSWRGSRNHDYDLAS